MRKRALLTFVGVCLVALAGSGAAAADRTQLQRGRQLSQLYCASCHAIDQTGDSPNRAAPRFRELHARYKIDDLAEGLAEGLLTGHPAMPEFTFSPDDVRAIIAYLKSIQTRQNAALATAGAR